MAIGSSIISALLGVSAIIVLVGVQVTRSKNTHSAFLKAMVLTLAVLVSTTGCAKRTEAPVSAERAQVQEYREKAKQGDAVAQNNLADCYMEGIGVDKDESLAFMWYQEAAKQGLAEAQYNVGGCYEYGFGTAKNEDFALKWYKKAAAQGHDGAKMVLRSYK